LWKEKVLEEFYSGPKSKYRLECKVCINEARRKYYKTSEGKEVSRKYQQKYNKTPQGKKSRKKRNLKRTYGLSLDDYNVLLDKQGGRCAICGEKPNKRHLDVDHDHDTKMVRGLLCNCCNFGIGYFKYDLEKMAKAIQYGKWWKVGFLNV